MPWSTNDATDCGFAVIVFWKICFENFAEINVFFQGSFGWRQSFLCRVFDLQLYFRFFAVCLSLFSANVFRFPSALPCRSVLIFGEVKKDFLIGLWARFWMACQTTDNLPISMRYEALSPKQQKLLHLLNLCCQKSKTKCHIIPL